MRYEIAYEDLVPLIMWVASGATSAYTAHDDREYPGEDFKKNAGFVEARNVPGLVAIEFAGTRFEEILLYVDFCKNCIGDSRSDLLVDYNSRLERDALWQRFKAGDFSDRDRERSYINTDLDSDFYLNFLDSSIEVKGEPARYIWSGFAQSELRQIDEIRFFLRDADSVLEQRAKQRTELELAEETMAVALAAVEAMEEASEPIKESLQDTLFQFQLEKMRRLLGKEWDVSLHEPGLWFFRTVALLRYFKKDDQERWESFLAQVQDRYSEIEEPWALYASAFEEVHKKSPLPPVN